MCRSHHIQRKEVQEILVIVRSVYRTAPRFFRKEFSSFVFFPMEGNMIYKTKEEEDFYET